MQNQNQTTPSKNQKITNLLKSRLTSKQKPTIQDAHTNFHNIERILKNNEHWAHETLIKNPHFFQKLKEGQKPQYLWIGCSDSRVPANEIIELEAGELFVHRNIANQVPLSDVNCSSVIQFAVGVLKVKDIIVCGHYGCGGIRACFSHQDYGPLQSWLSHIRSVKAKYSKQLHSQNQIVNETLLVQFNVKQNVWNVCRMPIVQKTWRQGGELRVHGLVYRLQDGLLNNLHTTIDSMEQLPEQFRIY